MASLDKLPDVAPLIKPLSWLLGKWRSFEGEAIYPTMKPFQYIEELEFFHVGQPNIQFNFNSTTMDSKTPLHRESGFIRVDPNSNQIAFVISMNIGVCEIEEGTIDGHTIKTETKTIGSISFGKEPRTKKLSRTLRLEGDVLEQVVFMATSRTEEQQHLKAKYRKI